VTGDSEEAVLLVVRADCCVPLCFQLAHAVFTLQRCARCALPAAPAHLAHEHGSKREQQARGDVLRPSPALHPFGEDGGQGQDGRYGLGAAQRKAEGRPRQGDGPDAEDEHEGLPPPRGIQGASAISSRQEMASGTKARCGAGAAGAKCAQVERERPAASAASNTAAQAQRQGEAWQQQDAARQHDEQADQHCGADASVARSASSRKRESLS
jgi:hypothetical protein